MYFIKVCGLLSVFFAAVTLGYIKSRAVMLRTEQLSKTKSALCDLAEKMRYSKCELETLKTECFAECPFLSGRGSFLNGQDLEVLNEFFDGCGALDSESEYKRATLYISVISRRYEDAAADSTKSARLYKTAGIGIGLAAVIMFI